MNANRRRCRARQSVDPDPAETSASVLSPGSSIQIPPPVRSFREHNMGIVAGQ